MESGSPSPFGLLVTARDFQRQPGRYQRLAQARPLTITAHGQPSLVVMSVGEYERLTGKRGKQARPREEQGAEGAVPSAPDLKRVLAALRRLRPDLEARGIAHAGVFGSVARNRAGPSSDIDVVVTPRPGRKLDLFDLGGVQELLDACFEGVDVDVVVEPVTRPELLEAIREDRVDAF